ncbi:MAG: hypothetical protein ACTSXP_06645, partial [Promethearchaeota archaeon]
GYYGICPWSPNERYYICLETDFHDHMPRYGDAARIMLLDLKDGTSRLLTETKGWNFQQGAMIHWLPSDPDRKIIFNDCDDGGAYSRVLDVETGDGWRLPRAINAVAHRRDLAACVNFSRLRRFRRVTSLPYSIDYSAGGVHPRDDGIFLMDLQSGNLELILTLDQAWNSNPVTKKIDARIFRDLGLGLWFNHVAFNPRDKRLHFLCRFQTIFRSLQTSMWTVDIDGSDTFLLIDFFKQLSHFEWINDKELIVTMNWPRKERKSHVRVVDKAGIEAWHVIARDKLTWDGHPHVSPNGRLMATDCYPINNQRHVYVVELEKETIHEIASFYNPPEINGDVRCDPHPRWNHDGTVLSFDGLDGNMRQVFAVEIRD